VKLAATGSAVSGQIEMTTDEAFDLLAMIPQLSMLKDRDMDAPAGM